jgi:hypothetical protein
VKKDVSYFHLEVQEKNHHEIIGCLKNVIISYRNGELF